MFNPNHPKKTGGSRKPIKLGAGGLSSSNAMKDMDAFINNELKEMSKKNPNEKVADRPRPIK